MKMIFKPLSNEKAGTIYRLLSESYKAFLNENPHCRESWQRDWRNYDSDVSSHPDTIGECGFFSYADRKLAGFASFDPRGHPERAIIGHNCILPAFRRKGYGKIQLRELVWVLEKSGFHKAIVMTATHEYFVPAVRMYKSCGFRETGNSGTDEGSGLKTTELELDLAVRIRRAERKDFDRVFALFGQLWPEKKLNWDRQMAVYDAMLSSDEYDLLCAEQDGIIAGFASLSIQHNFWQGGPILYITTLIVDEKARSRGIGTALIRAIETIAADRKCGKIELDSAFHRVEAHAFYEKNGFTKRAYLYSKDVI